MNERKLNLFDERRVDERVSKLEEAMDAHFAEHTQFVMLLTEGIKNVETSGTKMATSMSEIAEVVKIYNDTRGFVATMRILGRGLLWLTAVGGALLAVGVAIKHWMQS